MLGVNLLAAVPNKPKFTSHIVTMKTPPFHLLAPAAALVLLAANLSIAQDAPRRPGAARDGDRPAGAPRDGERPAGAPRDGERPQGAQREGGFRGGGGFGGFQPIELTEDQREAVREVMEEHRDDTTVLGEKMRDARKAYNDAVLADKADQNKIKASAKEVANIQAEQMIVQAKIFAKIRPKLTAAQLEQIKNSPAGIMMLGGMGGPGMGRPGFGGPGGQRPDGQGVRPEGESRRPRPEGDAPTPQRRSGRPEVEKKDQ